MAQMKYVAIAKVKHPNHFVKYRTTKPDKFHEFLIKKFGDCLWINFYYKDGDQKGKLSAMYGKKKGYQTL